MDHSVPRSLPHPSGDFWQPCDDLAVGVKQVEPPIALLTPAQASALRRKVMWRLLPLVILIYMVAFIDRANVGFAKLRMAGALGFSEEVFGLGMGIFFLGYLVLEIPGALVVERGSARRWFSRILISWGLISALTAFVRTPAQFYFARFSLGVAEAGFFPGIIVYFTHWFADRDRIRAFSALIMAVPVSLALGAPLSALILNVQWLGLVGWQWLFILEGLPAVVIGVVTMLYMTDRPQDAKWLTAQECNHIESAIVTQVQIKSTGKKSSLLQALHFPNVWLLALGIFAANTGGYALIFWLPTVIRHLSGGSEQAALQYSALFYVCGLIGVFFSGQSSDRSGDCKWRCVIGQVASGALLAISAISGMSFGFTMTCLCLTSVAAYFWGAPFWTLPTVTLRASAAAASIGFINMCANLAGYLGNYTTGWLRDHSFGDSTCLLFFSFCYVAGGLLVSFVKIPEPEQGR